MTEKNLKFHYQTIKSDNTNDSFTVHEAFSTLDGDLYMINPFPVFVVGDSNQEVAELLEQIEKDLDAYGVVEWTDVQKNIDKYIDYSAVEHVDYSEDDLDEDEMEEDFYDTKGNVIAIDDYIKRNK